ncbi:zona pellucida sperm-binding protein 3-like [Chelonoidis abingdonii]|uniref:zona pellucida sperm-binding protein 3-like n=1 Tax=Chelonoidis abingdonii TaxID=106734 RepID=UPI0013F226C8|nr:zona pellucida sperm-binding protein 3-like [Chelonoidis abingdonii]
MFGQVPRGGSNIPAGPGGMGDAVCPFLHPPLWNFLSPLPRGRLLVLQFSMSRLDLMSLHQKGCSWGIISPLLGTRVWMTPDSLVFSTSLNYNPTPASNPVILRTNPAVIPIECHYPRKDNESSKAIKPTWVPFSTTLSAEERLGFSLRLMNGDW